MGYTKEIGIHDFYNYYVETCKENGVNIVDYKTYTSIIKDCNLIIRDKVINHSEKFTLPYRNGTLSIIKFENKFNPDKQYKWKVDYVKTKELGFTVYFGSQYGYRWKWNKSIAITPGKWAYHFKPVRQASRLIAQAIKNNIDYYEK